MRSLFLLSIAVMLIALARTPGLAQSNAFVTTHPGPGLFIDSLWGFAISLPEKYVAYYHPHDSLNSQYDGFVGLETDPVSTTRFIAYRWSRFLAYLQHYYNPPPQYTADPDTVKQIVAYFCHRAAGFSTAASYVVIRTDSIAEGKTNSGLRMFVQYATQMVDYNSDTPSDTSALPPTYYVAVPDGKDWTFVMISWNFDPDHPPRAKLEAVATIAKSVQAWRRQ